MGLEDGIVGIVMHPSWRELGDVSIKHLQNCPITKKDIRVADDFFGPDLGSLKGGLYIAQTPAMCQQQMKDCHGIL